VAGEARYLDPAIVARLGTIDLKVRTIVEGFLTGLHRSPYKGFSVEFAEYRQYIPGDDLATLDWKVFARSDRHFVKKYEEETNLTCHLLLDVSGSMGYGSGAITKLQYGSYLTGALAYLMNRQRDAFGLIAFDDSIAALKHFRYRGTDVVVFHVLDPYELKFPFEQSARFRDMETAEEVMAVPSAVRQDYLERMQTMIAFYRRELGLAGIDYCLLDTSQPLELGLMAYLMTRRRVL
jgi:hypothetical protein